MNVIENERQLKITRKWIRKFRDQIYRINKIENADFGSFNPLRDVYLAAYESQLHDLIIQVSKYLRKRNARINIKSIRYRNSI